MFDKLEDLIHHYEELMNLLSEPDVANDANRFKKLMKEQSDLAPIVETYKKYKECKQNIEDSLAILDEESDEEMRELAKEELKDSKEQVEELEKKLKILLLPKDPNDDKNVIVENPCRCRRRGSSTFCSGNLPYVCALRREQRLEGGDT